MLSFGTLLREANIDPADVRLVRHGDGRHDLTPYHLWRANRGGFELYQRIQRRQRFSGAGKIASFVVTPLGETLFVGLYAVDGVATVPDGTIDPISGQNAGGKNLYTLNAIDVLSDAEGRVVIEWGEGYRAWVQLGTNEKPVVEIRRNITDPPFPGFLIFRSRLSALRKVPESWRQALAAVSGVYVLTRCTDGKHYVGCASGAGGFWARWEQYLDTGHGGNVRMREFADADYQVAILEVASSSADLPAIVELEGLWKEKLMSRSFGLNAN